MARALMPPVSETNAKRFSLRYTSIGMISHAVKIQGVGQFDVMHQKSLVSDKWQLVELYTSPRTPTFACKHHDRYCPIYDLHRNFAHIPSSICFPTTSALPSSSIHIRVRGR